MLIRVRPRVKFARIFVTLSLIATLASPITGLQTQKAQAAIDSTNLIYDFQATNYNASNGQWTNSVNSSTITRTISTGSSNPSKGSSPSSVDFNGATNGYQFITLNQYTNPQAFSINLWFKTSTPGGKIIGFEEATGATTSTAYDRQLYVGSDGKLYFGIYPGSIQTLSTSYAVTDNQWRNVVVTFSSSVATLYVNGSLVSSANFGAAQNYSGYWRIGGYKLSSWTNATDGYFNGSIGRASIYTRALNSTEATAAYNDDFPSYNPCLTTPDTTTSPGYTILSFTSVTTCGWTVPAGVTTADVLVVGGGGAGGGSQLATHYAGGGGGGGGVRSKLVSISQSTYTVTVGAGQSVGCAAGRAGDSVFAGAGITTVTASGGGRGSCNTSLVDGAGGIVGSPGGSGGGAGSQTYPKTFGAGNFGGFTPVEGYAGGTALADTGNSAKQAGGGGGGAGAAGGNAIAGVTNNACAGAGGNGFASSISGTARIYGGGGGGGIRDSTCTAALGGTGGGGTGGDSGANGTVAAQGTAGTDGFGGGGGGTKSFNGNKGGSGIVIVKYANSVAYSYNLNGGTGTTPSSGSALSGSSFTTAPSTGLTLDNYSFLRWNTAADGSGTSFNANTLVTMPASNTPLVLYAQWVQAYAITVTQNSNGLISPGTTNVSSGASQTFTFSPASGYNVKSIVIDGTALSGTALQNAIGSGYTFTNVTATRTITATYSSIVSSGLLINLDATRTTSLATGQSTSPVWTSIAPGSSTKSATGTTVSSVATSSTVSPTPPPSSVYFETSGRQVAPNGPHFNYGNSVGNTNVQLAASGSAAAISLEAWINIKSMHGANGWDIIATKWFADSNRGENVSTEFHFGIIHDASNVARLSVYARDADATGCENITTNKIFSTGDFNKWMLVAFTISATGTLNMYINGVAQDMKKSGDATLYKSVSTCNMTAKANASLLIGDPNADASFNGGISKFRMYNVALTAAQMQENYNSDALTFGATPRYTLTYNYDGATGSNTTLSSDYNLGETSITLPNPTKTGYTFGGWYAESGLSNLVGQGGTGYTPSSSATLFAKWTANKYVYNSNGGSGTMADQTYAGAQIKAPVNTFTPPVGATFVGWCTAAPSLGSTCASATGISYLAGSDLPVPTSQSITLYAVWIGQALTPTFGAVTYGTDGSYTIQVTNYDSSFSWVYEGGTGTPTAGTAVGSIIPITVTPSRDTAATLKVTTTKTNFATGTATSIGYYGGCIATTTTNGNYTVQTITNTGTCNWNTPANVSIANILVVAGGGGGGDSAPNNASGTGGAGGLFTRNNVPITGAIQINVGAGGAGANGTSAQAPAGGDSWFGTLKVGGGGGANSYLYNSSGAGAGGGGSTYVTGGNGGGGTPNVQTNGKVGGLGGSSASGGVTFLGNTYVGANGVAGGNGSDGASGGWGGSIALASRTSLISGTSVVYAKPGTYRIWDYSGVVNADNPQTYGSGGSANYTYSGAAEPVGYTTGGAGKQGVVIISYITTALTPTFDTPVKTATGFTVNVTNYDSNFTFTPSTTAGSIAAGTASGSSLPLTITGLTAGQGATITVATLGNGLSGTNNLSSGSNKASQTVSFSSTAPTTATVGGTTYTVTGSATSALTPVFTIDATASSICSINSSNVVSFLIAGSCKININQAGNDTYLAASQVQQSFTVGKGAQTITFAELVGKNYGDAAFDISATSTSGLTVVFTSATTSICTVSTTTVTIIAVGTCSINANQSGNANYLAATQVPRSFTVSALAALTPSFGTPIFESGKWSIDVTNYDSNAAITWGYTSANGTVNSTTAASGSTKRLVITPTSNIAATLTVTTTRTGYTTGTATTAAYYGGCNVTGVVSGSYTIYKFSNVGICSWAIPTGVTRADVLTVGGGGAGGTRAGGGGGAGGYLSFPGQTVVANEIVTVKVGAGGIPVINNSAGNGGESQFATLTAALGGGGGGGSLTSGNTARAGKDGGSGGGAAGNTTLTGSTIGKGTANQGNDGAPVYYSAADGYQWIGGGGGGSSSAGFMGTHPNNAATSTYWVAGKGGSGTLNSITGAAVCYATGGGGGIYSSWTGGAAGDCGGVANPNQGAGTAGAVTPATPPTANTGAGGGASGYSDGADRIGGAGATGVVVFRYISSALTPTFDTPVQGTSGFTVNVSNYDSNFVFTASVSTGIISVGTPTGTNLPLTITGLSAGQNVTVTINSAGGGFNATAELSSGAVKTAQVITFTAPSTKNILSGTFSLVGSTTSLLALTYVSTTTAVCTVTGATVTLLTSGTCTITASQDGDSTYLAAVAVPRSFSVASATITFNSNYGTATTSTQVISSAGNFALTANTFTRIGHQFAGWNTLEAGGGTSYANSASVTLTGDTVLFAQWNIESFGVSYNGNNFTSGAVPASTTNSYGSTVAVPLNSGVLARTGYTFGGWNTKDDGSGINYSAGTGTFVMGASAVILYARWNLANFSITYDGNGFTGGAVPNPTTHTYTSTVTVPLNSGALVKSGFTFGGWNTKADGTGTNYTQGTGTFVMGPGAMTLYAKWAANVYTLTYSYNGADGGESPVSSSYTTGETVITLPTPTKAGYSFEGWYSNVALSAFIGGAGAAYSPSSVATAIGAYAKWSAIAYTVTYQANGGSGTAPTESTKTIGTSISVKPVGSVNKSGYDFAGWNDGISTYQPGTNNYTVGGANVVFTAQWNRSIYVITYSANGGSGNGSRSSDNYTYADAAITLPTVGTLSRLGYSFGGWSLTSDGSSISGSYTPTETKTLYAVWNAITYAITYNKNGATGSITDGTSSYTTAGDAAILPTVGNMKKTGYNFAGWSTTTSGAIISTSTYTTSVDVTLYAIWTIKSIGYSYSRGVAVSGTSVPAGGSANYASNLTLAAPTATSYSDGTTTFVFLGWNDTVSTYQSGATYRLGTADVVFTALWVAIYGVRYTVNGGVFAPGETNKDVECSTGDFYCTNAQPITSNAAPTRIGYTFTGWKDQSNTTIAAASPWTISDGSYLAYAQWSADDYAAIYKSDDTNLNLDSTVYHIGDLVTVKAGITKTGFTFVGWLYNGQTYGENATIQLGAGSIELIAQWSAINYTLIFDTNGGSAISTPSTLKVYLASFSTPAEPTRDGYVFASWSDGSTTKAANTTLTMPAAHVTYTAQWTAIDYSVSYLANGGATTPNGITGKKIGDKFLVENAISQNGRKFLGWFDGSNTYLPGQSYTVRNQDIQLQATWSGQLYTVTYAHGGGSGLLPTLPDRLQGESFTVEAGTNLSKLGFEFDGWQDGSGATYQFNQNYTVATSNITLTAKWRAVKYFIKYNSGTNATKFSEGTFNIGGGALKLPTPSRANYVFEGWFDQATGGNKVGNANVDYTPTSTSELYGRWTQASLYGVASTSLTELDNHTVANLGDRSATVNYASGSIKVDVPNGALPTGTLVKTSLLGDLTRARELIANNSNYVLNMVVSWVATDTTVPDTDPAKPIVMTITSGSIKKGAAIYSVIGTTATLLGYATKDGEAVIKLYSDPEIAILAVAPDAPTSVSAVADNSQATVSWLAPENIGGATITEYVVTSSGSQTCTTTGATSCVVNGLTNGVAYTFTVKATNSAGTSAASAPSAAVTPQGGSGISLTSASVATYGTPQTLTATLTGTDGAVDFKVGATSIPGCSSVSSSAFSASCLWTPTAVDAAVSITAVLTPSNEAFTPATSNAVLVNVGPRLVTIKAADKTAAYSGSAVSVTNSYSITSGTLVGSDAIESMSYTFSLANPTNAGTYTITPSAAVMSSGSISNYTFTYTTGTLTISTDALVLNFGPAPTGVLLGEAAGTHSVLATTSPAGIGSVVYASTTAPVCTVNSVTGALTLITSGTCTVTANNSGDANYAAASQDTQTFNVAPIVITFDSNGAGVLSTTQILTSLNSTALTSNAFTRSGYTFKAWNTVDTGTGVAYANGANITPTVSLTLFAQWTAQQSSGGNAPTQPVTPAPVVPVIPPTNPVTNPVVPVVPVEPAKPVVNEVPTTPVTTSADGSQVINYTATETFTFIDGKPVAETFKVVDLIKIVTESQGVQLQLQAVDSTDKASAIDINKKLTLEHEGMATVAGTGFKIQTLVKVWLFSDPIYLGEFKVDASGKFVAELDILSSIPVGNHVLQVNGLTPDSKLFSQSIPVIVKAKQSDQPVDVTPKPDPVTPVVPKTPTAKPSVAKYAYTLWFRSNSDYLNKGLRAAVKKFSPRVRAAKVVTCIAYIDPTKSKRSYKLELSRAKNSCLAINKLFKTKKKIVYKTAFIKTAGGKVKAPSKSRNARVDIFVR